MAFLNIEPLWQGGVDARVGLPVPRTGSFGERQEQ